MDKNPDMKAVNSIYHEDVRHKSEESAFNIAVVQYKSRTAAVPSNFWVFSKELDDSPHSSS